MKNKWIFLICLVFVSEISGENLFGELGGIIYVKNGKIIYEDLELDTRIDLLSGNEEFNVRKAGICPNGKTLMFSDENNSLKLRMIPHEKIETPKHLPIKENIKKIKPSLEGESVAYQRIQERNRTSYKRVRAYMIDQTRPFREWITWRFGNAPIYPEPYRDRPSINIEDEFQYQTYRGISHEEGMLCFSVKRDAVYFDWNPAASLLAVMYKTERGWGPIEIRNTHRTSWSRNPNRINIDISPPSCEGMSWTPNGSLSILVNGDLFIIPVTEIRREIKNTRSRWLRKVARTRERHGAFAPVILTPDIHWVDIRPQKIAERINGNKIQWISERSFIFRKKNGELYLWEEGKKTLLKDFVPEDYSFCPPNVFLTSSGKEKVRNLEKFRAGGIRISVSGVIHRKHDADENTLQRMSIQVAKYQEYPLSCRFIEDKKIEEIEDPSTYDYEAFYYAGRMYALKENKISIFKFKNGYLAIKPTEVFFCRKKTLRRNWAEKIDGAEIKWKFWPLHLFEDDVSKILE